MHIFEGTKVNLNLGFSVLATFLFFIGIWFTLPPFQLPGDLGDTRFNLYVLEHGYRWLIGEHSSFWDAPFFFPAENTLAYSDSHIGTFFIFAFFRVLDFGPYDALYGWLFVCTLFNYISCLWVSRKFGLLGLAPIIAAFIFSFGLPVSGLIGHVQIVPRFWVPLAFLMAFRLLNSGNYKYFYLLFLTVIAQLYASIYTGYFLSLCLVGFLGYLFMAGERGIWGNFFSANGSMHLVGSSTMSILLLLPLAIPHYLASKSVGARSWEEISTMLPRLLSYLRSPHSEMWASVLPESATLPMAHEHPLFFGVVPLILFGVFCVRWRSSNWDRSTRKLGKAMVMSVALVFIFTLSISGFSLYRLVSSVPGVSGIRAVSRIATVLVFPLGVIAGLVANHYLVRLKSQLGAGVSHGVSALLVVALLFDQRPVVGGFTKAQAHALTEPFKEQAESSDKGILWLADGRAKPNSFWETNLTAMLISQELGKATINGYSGSLPPGYPGELFTHRSSKLCEAVESWMASSGHAVEVDQVLQLGSVKCELESVAFGAYLGGNFYAWEGGAGKPSWAWAKTSNADVYVKMSETDKSAVRLSFFVGAIRSGTVKVVAPGEKLLVTLDHGETQAVSLTLTSTPDVQKIEIQSDINPQLPGNGDPRELTFYVKDLKLEKVDILK